MSWGLVLGLRRIEVGVNWGLSKDWAKLDLGFMF